MASAALTYVTANCRVTDYAMTDDSDQVERPRLEPEIIPPGRTRSEPDWAQSGWRPYASTTGGTQRIYIAGLGPFGIALLMLAIGALAAVILLAVLGAILIWIPVFALLLVAGFAFRLLRR
jgi:Flp pilus assembly protein TadB